MVLGGKIMNYIIKNDKDIIAIAILEEYIPLKIIFDKRLEEVKYISYCKDEKSYLEITIGVQTHLIKKIILLLSEKYDFLEKNLIIDESKVKVKNLIIEEKLSIECSEFITYVFTNGVRIKISNKDSTEFIKMDKVYIGLSESNEVTEICILQLTENEISHIKNELKLL